MPEQVWFLTLSGLSDIKKTDQMANKSIMGDTQFKKKTMKTSHRELQQYQISIYFLLLFLHVITYENK